MEMIVMALLAVVNGGYIYYLHRRLQHLDAVHRAQAASDRRLILTALEVGGELRALTENLEKQGEWARRQHAELNRYLSGLIKAHFGNRQESNGNGNGRRPRGQAAPRPGNGHDEWLSSSHD